MNFKSEKVHYVESINQYLCQYFDNLLKISNIYWKNYQKIYYLKVYSSIIKLNRYIIILGG